jgi:CDP-diglyceride synthetase
MEHFKRITSALVILPPLLLFLYYAPKELFLVFVLALVALSLREYVHMLALVKMPGCPKTSFIAVVTLVGAAHFGGAPRLSLGLSLSLVLLCSCPSMARSASLPCYIVFLGLSLSVGG